MKIVPKTIVGASVAGLMSIVTAQVPAQDIVIDSGSNETVISRLPAAGVEDSPVCSDSVDGTLGRCAAAASGTLLPFALSCSEDITVVTTVHFCETSTVPAGFTFVVEHMSGAFVTGEDEIVDSLHASNGSQVVYLPVQFVARKLNYGDPLGVGQANQYGSPARMYVPAGGTVVIRGDSNRSGRINFFAIGYLVPDPK